MCTMIVDFTKDETMPVTKGPSNTSAVEGNRLTILISALALVVTIVVTGIAATHVIENEIATKNDSLRNDLSAKIEGLDKRMTKAEDSIKVLSSQQSDQTQRLVRDLLTSATSAPEPGISTKLLAAAKSIVGALQDEKVQAKPDFFQKGIEALNRIEKEHGHIPAAFSTRVMLAEYRSSLEVLPKPRVALRFGKMEHAIINPGNIFNIELDFRDVSGSAIVLGPDSPRDMTVGNVVIDGGYQVLDGIRWQDVYFVGTKIRYDGGKLHLNDVHFVNCTFDNPTSDEPTPRGRRVIDYAALSESKLEIDSPHT